MMIKVDDIIDNKNNIGKSVYRATFCPFIVCVDPQLQCYDSQTYAKRERVLSLNVRLCFEGKWCADNKVR